MPLHIIREDITRMKVDAIVAAGSAKPGTPTPTGGVNGSIHKKAGARLVEALRRLGGINTGCVTLTQAYDLPCKYVIHTAGPVWKGGSYGEETLLRSCYREALALAVRKRFDSMAFPLISSGKYGYPKAEAMKVATSEIRAFLQEHELDVYLVVYDREAFAVSSEMFAGVQAFIDQHYVDDHRTARNPHEEEWAARYHMSRYFRDADHEKAAPQICEAVKYQSEKQVSYRALFEATEEVPEDWNEQRDAFSALIEEAEKAAQPEDQSSASRRQPLLPARKREMARLQRSTVMLKTRAREKSALSLEERLRQLDEGFSQALLRLIDEKGMKDSVCYRKANVDRKLFNKIKNTPGYTPKKSTVMAFCVALELDMRSCRELLSRAGYALSRSSMFDVIVEYYIGNGTYDVDAINQALFAYDQPLLGSNVG